MSRPCAAALQHRLYLLIFIAFTACLPALADGPHIALHATQGPYEVTVFSAPDPLVTGPIELSVLVQDTQTGALLPAVSASGSLTLPSGAPIPLTLTLSGSSSHQLPGETVQLAAPGAYTLRLLVVAGRGPAALFIGTLPVDANRGKRNTVLWAVFLVLAVIGLFFANQTAKQRLRAARARAG